MGGGAEVGREKGEHEEGMSILEFSAKTTAMLMSEKMAEQAVTNGDANYKKKRDSPRER